MFTADWGQDLNSDQVEKEIKRFTEDAMIRIKRDLKHHIKIDGETVEVIFTADWEMQVSNSFSKFEILEGSFKMNVLKCDRAGW